MTDISTPTRPAEAAPARPPRRWTFRRRAIAWLFRSIAYVLAGRSVRFVVPLRDSSQRIYFANHTSHLDFLLVWAALPPVLRRQTRPVAGLDYWSRSRLKRYLAEEVFGAVLIERPSGDGLARRDGAAGLAPVIDALRAGDSLVFFPEGTRGSGRGIAPFKSGLFHLARACPDIELVPVRIGGAARVLAKGQWVPVPRTSRLAFGPPLRMQEGESKEAFLARAREAVVLLPEG